ncbi:MICOS complex subunit MIC13-like [Haliotis rufescens]|uniref:MICOS complex subunit MIC13-like n=1 Tax=Haliotis rufescens TaxID=6454 RepID=UPI001EAFA167|nr:MICOS complex subunit MIC13-like [Haliotis rufescens]
MDTVCRVTANVWYWEIVFAPKMATTLVKLASKLAIGAGAVYVTIDQGVWSNSSNGSQALEKVKGSVLPAASDYAKQIPSLDDVNNTVLSGWNSGVKTVFYYVSSAPDTAGEYSKKAVSSSVNFVRGN